MNKFLVFIGILLSTSVSGQKDPAWQPALSFSTPIIKEVSSDPYNFIYIADEKGDIHKFDSLGHLVLMFSPRQNSEVTLLDAWRNVNVFLFYRNFQQYRILNRFLNEIVSEEFDSEGIGYVRLATLSADNNLWILDDNDYSLKKINLQFNSIVIKNDLELVIPPSDYEYVYIREYNNNLYIADKNSGILVFDNIGNYKTRINAKNVEFFAFAGDEIYYLNNNKLTFLNLRTGRYRLFPLPASIHPAFVLINASKAYFFEETSVKVYKHSIDF